MEVDAVLEMILSLDQENVDVTSIVSDDDTTMLAHLQHAIINKKQVTKKTKGAYLIPFLSPST